MDKTVYFLLIKFHCNLYFSGVDMVDGTPVLDIKPYIPQYDYPGIAELNITDNCNISSRIRRNVAETDSERNTDDNNHLDNMNERVMDGEENGHVASQMAPENSRYVL